VRWRQVAFLYAVLGALAADYWLVERRTEPAPAVAVRRPFLAVPVAEVREVRLVRAERRVVARRADGAWAVVEPAGASIPPDLIAAFADALTGAQQIETVAAEDAGRAFGLDGDAARVELLTQGGESIVILIGTTNATGTGVYARRGEASEIVLIGRNVRYYEELIFQAIPAVSAPARGPEGPVGG
jgi:Domain of unknown function (DUF4340)